MVSVASFVAVCVRCPSVLSKGQRGGGCWAQAAVLRGLTPSRSALPGSRWCQGGLWPKDQKSSFPPSLRQARGLHVFPTEG